MPASKAELVLEAMRALLETVPGATVARNSVLPEKIPAGGLIILRDGDPGEPEQALDGFGSTYYQHAVEIEVYVEEGDAAARDAAFDNLLRQIGVALEADLTLGGLAFGLTYGRPESAIEAVAGAPAVKTATLTVTINYESYAPLLLITDSLRGDPDGASLWFERAPAPEARHHLWPRAAGNQSRIGSAAGTWAAIGA